MTILSTVGHLAKNLVTIVFISSSSVSSTTINGFCRIWCIRFLCSLECLCSFRNALLVMYSSRNLRFGFWASVFASLLTNILFQTLSLLKTSKKACVLLRWSSRATTRTPFFSSSSSRPTSIAATFAGERVCFSRLDKLSGEMFSNDFWNEPLLPRPFFAFSSSEDESLSTRPRLISFSWSADSGVFTSR